MTVRSSAYLPVPFSHWQLTRGVVTTFFTGPFVQSRWPSGVSTLSVPMLSASPALSFGFFAALIAAMPTSNSAAVEPTIWVHCLPVAS
jgi:hypothetical protein